MNARATRGRQPDVRRGERRGHGLDRDAAVQMDRVGQAQVAGPLPPVGLGVAPTVDVERDRQVWPDNAEPRHRVERNVELIRRREGTAIDQAERSVGHERAPAEAGGVEPREVRAVEDDRDLAGRHAQGLEASGERLVDRDDRVRGGDRDPFLELERPEHHRVRGARRSASGRTRASPRGDRGSPARPRGGTAGPRTRGNPGGYGPGSTRIGSVRSIRPPRRRPGPGTRGTRAGRCRGWRPGGAGRRSGAA